MILELAAAAVLGFIGGLAGGYIASLKLKPGIRVPELVGHAKGKTRRRYVVFEVLTSERVSFEELEAALKTVVRNVYGELGEAAMRAYLVEYNEVRRRGIVRVRSPYKDHVLAVLGLIRSAGNRGVLIAPIAVTGSLKRARKLVEA